MTVWQSDIRFDARVRFFSALSLVARLGFGSDMGIAWWCGGVSGGGVLLARERFFGASFLSVSWSSALIVIEDLSDVLSSGKASSSLGSLGSNNDWKGELGGRALSSPSGGPVRTSWSSRGERTLIVGFESSGCSFG